MNYLLVLIHWIHGSLLRLLYKIIAPGHPRGWLDIHCIVENDEDPNTCWVHCHGMTRWKLPNIELVGVPSDLAGYAHGIMFDIVGYMKSEKEIKKDENLGGLFVSEDQIVPHQCTFRLVRHEDEPVEREFLRVVDIGEPTESGFPRKLFAAHLLALAVACRNPTKQIPLLRRSVELWPGALKGNPETKDAAAENPNNYFSWEALGNALCDAGDVEQGLRCLREAAGRWPFGAQSSAEMYRGEIKEGRLPPPEVDPRSKFWSNLDAVQVREEMKTGKLKP